MTNKYIKIIKNYLPFFHIKSCTTLNTGANNIALLVNKNYVFRFLLDKNNFHYTLKEKQCLDFIRPFIKSTKIPELNICDNPDIPFTYHKLIEGIDYYKYKDPSKNFKEKLAKNLACFCKELHIIDTGSINFIEHKDYDPLSDNFDNKKFILKELFGQTCLDDINKKIDFLINYKNTALDNNTLCHTDLHEENILVNKDGLAGIIDFECMKQTKRDIEFSFLFGYDPELNIMLIREYEKLTNKKIDIEYTFIVNKIRYYKSLSYFIETNNKKYIDMFINYIGILNKWEPTILCK